jgi:dTDP-4-dehydrorhamnose reductase
LREAAARDTSVVLGFTSRSEVDLLRPWTIRQALTRFRPDVVINPAAYTAVDKAESEPDQAFAINRDGAGVVAEAAEVVGAPVIHFSTDYVFDGHKEGPYVEGDPVAPQGVYGMSKLQGEVAVATAHPRHVILRTAWVYAPFGSNFLRTILRLAAERDRLQVVDDQVGCPTYAPDIADAVLAIAVQIAGTRWKADHAGVTHLAGPDSVSWCGFARMIVALSAEGGRRFVPVDPIATRDYPTPAARPANSCLSTARLSSLFGIQIPPLETSLASCLARLLPH